jgi:hypothetical protein
MKSAPLYAHFIVARRNEYHSWNAKSGDQEWKTKMGQDYAHGCILSNEKRGLISPYKWESKEQLFYYVKIG